jgi:hypothetical protein
MRRIMMTAALLSLPLAAACSDGDDAGSEDRAGDVAPDTTGAADPDDRTSLWAEVDGVRVEVADCFVVDMEGSRRYQTTVEVRNDSSETHDVAVTIVADLGRGGTSDAFEVAAGATDAWAVTADEATDDPVGDAVCTDFITEVELVLDGVAG